MPWDLIGHEWAVRLLQRDLAHNRVRHAYLFTGPAGIGRRTLVTQFAQALLCAAPQPPCGQCRACQLTSRGVHPDLLTVAPEASGRRVRAEKIRIEPVRSLIYALGLRPVEARRRVARLLRFDLANVEAMNAFLKTLEEPAPGVVILITAESADDLLPTIVSRCQVFPLRPLALDSVAEALVTRWGLEPERARSLAHLSGGRLGLAVNLHQESGALEARTQRIDELEQLLQADRVQRFAYAERLARIGSLDRIQDTLELWQGYWRDVLLAAAQTHTPLTHLDRAPRIQALAARLAPHQAARALEALRRTGEMLDKNANARLALEVLLLDWPQIAD